jgi:hypothetical protein
MGDPVTADTVGASAAAIGAGAGEGEGEDGGFERDGARGAVKHSGDLMNHATRAGKHIINVDLERLARADVAGTDLFFTLSAYNSGDLQKFREPRFHLFDTDAADSAHALCEYSVFQAGHAESVVVGCLTRAAAAAPDGRPRWRVLAFGTSCRGTIRDYSSMLHAARRIQQRHAAWAERVPLVVLRALSVKGRGSPRDDDDGTMRLDKAVKFAVTAREDVWRLLVRFLGPPKMEDEDEYCLRDDGEGEYGEEY